jgi:D-arabinose 1-dehydrogenase-like Zn-dependent alcohol dehydrogenase
VRDEPAIADLVDELAATGRSSAVVAANGVYPDAVSALETGTEAFREVVEILTHRGSIVGTHRDLEETFELRRRGLTRVLRSECRLDDVNDAAEQVLDGSAPAPRMVFDMAPVAARKVATGATMVGA